MSSQMQKTPSKFEKLLTSLAGNLLAVLPSSVKGIPVNGQVLTPNQVVSQLQQGATLFTNATQAKQAAQEAVVKRKEAEPGLHALVDPVVTFLRLVLGSNVAALARLGIEPQRKRGKPSAVKRAAGVIKGQATRKANQPAPKAEPTLVLYGADGQPLPGTQAPTPPVSGGTSGK